MQEYLVSEREILMNGCVISPHIVSHKCDRYGVNLFSIRDVRPSSSHGDRWLRRKYEQLKNEEELQRRAKSIRSESDLIDAMSYTMAKGQEAFFDESPMYDWGKDRLITKRKPKIMNEKQILADSLLDNFNTINVCFEKRYDGVKMYTYKVPKDWEFEDPEENDIFVIVPPGGGNMMRVAQVVEVHGKAKNPDNIKLKWAIGQVDTFEYDNYVETDRKALDTLMEVEKRKAKRELLEEFSDGLSKKELKQLESDLGVDLG